ncbi:MAG: Rap1a/Tai family immunity protein [Deltaproteobacteria bacterium]|nr:Rap1a/Tai family immunity protein [Deltaproteobacteria bacterium]
MRHRLVPVRSPAPPRAVLLGLVFVLLPLATSAALTEDDFFVKSAQDLVDICSSPESDPLNDAADHFCQGFVVGAWQYHQAQAAGPKGVRLACPPDPPPTRNEVVTGFVAWAGKHPEHMAEPAVDTLFRYLVELAPCPGAEKGGAQ